MSTKKSESEKGAIEKSVEELLRVTVGYARTLFVLGFLPWRAGQLVEGERTVAGHVATFLFISSFFLSVALGVLTDVLWRFSGLDALQDAALRGISSALHPNLGEALISLLPGLVCAHLAASLLARLLEHDAANDSRMYRLAFLAFALHGFIVATVISLFLLLINALVGLALAEALTPALLHHAYQPSFAEALLNVLFSYGPLVLSIFLILHFPAVAWFGARALNSPNAQPRRTDLFLVAAIYPLTFVIYMVSISLPHILITSLSPQTDKTVVLNIQTSKYLTEDSSDVEMSALLINQMGRAVAIDRQGGFELLFDDAPQGSPLSYTGIVADWSAGAGRWLVIPTGGSAWVIVRAALPKDFCARPGIFKESATYVQVVAKESMSGEASQEGKRFESRKEYFCTRPALNSAR
jgi:hypothetical protein